MAIPKSPIGISAYELIDAMFQALTWVHDNNDAGLAVQDAAQQDNKAAQAMALYKSLRISLLEPLFVKLTKAGGYELVSVYNNMRSAEAQWAQLPADASNTQVLRTLQAVLQSVSNIVRCYKVIYAKRDDSPLPPL